MTERGERLDPHTITTLRTKFSPQVKEFMGVEISPEVDELQMKINALPTKVRHYMALEFVMGRELELSERQAVLKTQRGIFATMSEEQKKELLDHQVWLAKRK